jgi:hypothetical protein
VPSDKVDKAELVKMIAKAFGRTDIKVRNDSSGIPKDLTLATENPGINSALWIGGGYMQIPTINQMIKELEP